MCYHEPLVDIIEDNGKAYTYGHVTPEIVKTIFAEHIEGGQPVEKYLVATSDSPGHTAQEGPTATRGIWNACDTR